MSLTIYDERACGAWCRLDQRHFDAANRDNGNGTLMFIGGGCLDAPEKMPGGSVKGYGKGIHAYGLPFWVARADMEMSPEEKARREALAEEMIAEILAEEAAERACA
jgi:hypothetical protein